MGMSLRHRLENSHAAKLQLLLLLLLFVQNGNWVMCDAVELRGGSSHQNLHVQDLRTLGRVLHRQTQQCPSMLVLHVDLCSTWHSYRLINVLYFSILDTLKLACFKV